MKLPQLHSEEQLREAETNLVHCLDGGEKGLQEALNRIYPATEAVRTSQYYLAIHSKAIARSRLRR